MLQRLLFLAIVAGCGWYAWSSGIFETYVMNEGNPVKGRICQGGGPTGDGFPLSGDEYVAKFEIDSHLGTAADRMNGRLGVSQRENAGDIIRVPDKTKIKILGTKKVMVQSAPFWICNVLVMNGKYEGAEGWVRREDVLDTPVAELYQRARKVEGKAIDR